MTRMECVAGRREAPAGGILKKPRDDDLLMCDEGLLPTCGECESNGAVSEGERRDTCGWII